MMWFTQGVPNDPDVKVNKTSMLLTPKEAMLELRCSRATLFGLLKTGENSVTFSVPAGEVTTGVVWDYIRLELNDGSKSYPAPPDNGRPDYPTPPPGLATAASAAAR